MQHKLTLIDALEKHSKDMVMMQPLNEKTKMPHRFCYLKSGKAWLEYWREISFTYLYKKVIIMEMPIDDLFYKVVFEEYVDEL